MSTPRKASDRRVHLRTRVARALAQQIPPLEIRDDTASLQSYGTDWTRIYPVDPLLVVFPRTAEVLQALVRFSAAEGFALVPSGGRTGMSGGAVASDGEIVVSMERMHAIGAFDPAGRTVRCQAGVVTAKLQEFAAEQGLYYPVDFGASGSSHIGGNIATNAGGIRVIRYGLTRDWVAGLTVVTGTGERLELNRGLIKNATGYDLRHLFIGSEGTLGFIVEATMRLTRPPQNLTVMLLAVPELQAIPRMLHSLQSELGLTACEFFPENAMRLLTEQEELRRPLARADYYMLAEFEDPEGAASRRALVLFEDFAGRGWAVDGVLSQSEAQAEEIWALRERIPEVCAGYTPYRNDIAVLPASIPAFLDELHATLAATYPDFEVIAYGHIGDGNLHVNVLKPAGMDTEEFFTLCRSATREVFALVQKHGGAISAEHGVGRVKKDYLSYTRSDTEIAYLRALKRIFDPHNIMNPGKLIDV